MKKTNLIFLPLGFSATFLLFSSTYAEISTVDYQREQAVLLIRHGDMSQGLIQLENLRRTYPKNQKLLADYLLSLKQAGLLDDRMLYLTEEIDYPTFPQYAHLPLLQGIRDQKKFALAIRLGENFNRYYPSNDLNLLLGVLYAEQQQTSIAKNYLSRVNIQILNISQLLQLSYAYRISGDLVTALDLAQHAYQQDTHSVEAQQEYYSILLKLDSVEEALTRAEQEQLSAENPVLYHQVKQAYFAQKIRHSIISSDYKMNWSEPSPYQELDGVLEEMAQYAKSIDQTQQQFYPFNYDYIYALSRRGNSRQAIELLNKIEKTGIITQSPSPSYVRHAIADAYLALRQPQQAELWYKSLLSDTPYLNFEVYTGLYYSYIEQEKYQAAETLLKDIEPQLPTLQYSEVKGGQPWVHPDRASYINLWGLHQAYSNRLNIAEQYYQDLLARAPNNTGYVNQLAMIQRWRNKPERSQQTLARLSGIQPISKSRYLNSMQNAQSLGDVSTWRTTLKALQEIDPEDTGVIKAQKELNDRNRPTITHQSSFGQSRAEQENVARSLQGLNDRESLTRLYSPWLGDQYRIFAQYDSRWSEYRQGEIDENRYGLGVEWSAYRKSLTAVFSQDESRDRAGVNLQWSHWLNDHWNYRLGADSAADIPLQALLQDRNGQSYNLGLTWQQDESRRADVGYKATDIDDGNLRQEFTASFNQAIWASPHHNTEATLFAYYGRNSLDNVPYFNPESNYSLELNFAHDWLTWREYEKSFNQHVEVMVGMYGQKGFSTLPMYAAQYRHEWKLSRTWQLNYGVGWRMHPYDGEQEQRIYGVIGFEGRF